MGKNRKTQLRDFSLPKKPFAEKSWNISEVPSLLHEPAINLKDLSYMFIERSRPEVIQARKRQVIGSIGNLIPKLRTLLPECEKEN
jgi:hypothetical protein